MIKMQNIYKARSRVVSRNPPKKARANAARRFYQSKTTSPGIPRRTKKILSGCLLCACKLAAARVQHNKSHKCTRRYMNKIQNNNNHHQTEKYREILLLHMSCAVLSVCFLDFFLCGACFYGALDILDTSEDQVDTHKSLEIESDVQRPTRRDATPRRLCRPREARAQHSETITFVLRACTVKWTTKI